MKLEAVAPLPAAGATSPRESSGFQRGAAGACPSGSSAGALAAISTAMDDTGAVVTHRRHIRYTDLDAHEEARRHDQ